MFGKKKTPQEKMNAIFGAKSSGNAPSPPDTSNKKGRIRRFASGVGAIKVEWKPKEG